MRAGEIPVEPYVADGEGGLCILRLGKPANSGPAVSDIPDQTIEEGKAFSSIRLDDYVTRIIRTWR